MTLNTRPLGTSGMTITTVGFGAWAIGGGWAHGWGPQSDAASIAAIRHAVDSGVNWIDTALRCTGSVTQKKSLDWRSARSRLTSAHSCSPRAVRLATRPTHTPSRSGISSRLRSAQRVEASLRRLGIEQIDLYQFHWPDQTGTPIEESWAEMVRLRDEGKVRAIGVSNFDVALLERAEAVEHVDSLQPPFSLIHRDSAAEVIPWAAAHGTGVICYSPMQSGILTEAFSADRVASMAADDWRRRSPDFQEPALSRNLAIRDALRPIAKRYDTTVSAVALSWVLAGRG